MLVHYGCVLTPHRLRVPTRGTPTEKSSPDSATPTPYILAQRALHQAGGFRPTTSIKDNFSNSTLEMLGFILQPNLLT